jgi:transketolase
VSLEAGLPDYWYRFVGPAGLAIGISTFGESAPLAQIQEHFGFTPDKVTARIKEWLTRS